MNTTWDNQALFQIKDDGNYKKIVVKIALFSISATHFFKSQSVSSNNEKNKTRPTELSFRICEVNTLVPLYKFVNS